MKEKENELWPQDRELLEEIIAHPKSENERNFFKQLRGKMENELAPCKEVHFSERDNADGIFFLRDQYDEFIIGSDKENLTDDYLHFMSLAEALSTNLKDVGFINRDVTMLDWLRERDYEGAMFDHNNAYL